MLLSIATVLLPLSGVKAIYHRQVPVWPPNTTAEDCNEDHSSDMFRPIMQVMKAHPGVDGYCYFEKAAKEFDALHTRWLHNINHRDYVQYGRQTIRDWHKSKETCPDGVNGEVLITFEKQKIISEVTCAHDVFDDIYFYALGWLKNQGLNGRLRSNPAAWQELARKECGKIHDLTAPTDKESTLGYNIEHSPVITAKAGCTLEGVRRFVKICETPTFRELRLHAYTKCLLGHGADEMAIGYAHGCLQHDDNGGLRIRHGDVCSRRSWDPDSEKDPTNVFR